MDLQTRQDVDRFIQYLQSLTREELTLFYCKGCYHSKSIPNVERPLNPYQEDTGLCTGCKAWRSVSNPHINKYENQQCLRLDYSQNKLRTRLIRDFLIPVGFTHFQYFKETRHLEGKQAWHEQGRKVFGSLFQSGLDEECMGILIPCYERLYGWTE